MFLINSPKTFSCRHVKIYDIQDYTVVHSMEYPSPILSLGVSVSMCGSKICLSLSSYSSSIFSQRYMNTSNTVDFRQFFPYQMKFSSPLILSWQGKAINGYSSPVRYHWPVYKTCTYSIEYCILPQLCVIGWGTYVLFGLIWNDGTWLEIIVVLEDWKWEHLPSFIIS